MDDLLNDIGQKGGRQPMSFALSFSQRRTDEIRRRHCDATCRDRYLPVGPHGNSRSANAAQGAHFFEERLGEHA
jgi:hypothetical protein